MENQGSQLTIIPLSTVKGAKYNFTCETCKQPFGSNRKDKRYCSSKCRADDFKKRAMNGPDNNPPVQNSMPQSVVKKMEINGLSPQMQIAVNLLQKEADRWEAAFKKEEGRREQLEKELIQLKSDTKDKELTTALQGLEDKRPTGLERFMDSLAKTPGPIVDQAAALIGMLGALIPKPKTLQGVDGQLDEITLEVVQWMQTKPPEFNKQIYTILELINSKPPDEQVAALQKIYNLLTAKNNVAIIAKNNNYSSGMQIFGS